MSPGEPRALGPQAAATDADRRGASARRDDPAARLAATLAALALAIGPGGGADAQVPDDAPCVLEAEPSLRGLAEGARRTAERRTGRRLALREGPSPTDPPARCLVRLEATDAGLRLEASGSGGTASAVELGDDGDEASTTRALAVALSDLLLRLAAPELDGAAQLPTTATDGLPAPPADGGPDEAARGEAPGAPDATPGAETAPPTVPPDVLAAAAPPDAATAPRVRGTFGTTARPVYATARDNVRVTLGLEAGVCVDGWLCATLGVEAALPEEDRVWDGPTASYAWGAATAGVRALPLEAGPLRVGAALGVVTRVAQLWFEGRASPALRASPGLRASIEASVAGGDGWALSLGAGADVMFEATRYALGGRPVLAEDLVTPWVSVGARFIDP